MTVSYAPAVNPVPSGKEPPFSPGPPASRLDQALRRAPGCGPLLIGCLPACWPPAADTGAYAVLAASADAVEVALPTPWAYLDGDTLRAAYGQALGAGYSHDRALDLIGHITAAGTLVLVMAYWHTVGEYGPGRMARELAAAGAAAAVLPDLPAAWAARWRRAAGEAGLHTILLADDVETPGDLDLIAGIGTGAVYVPAAPGPTGTGAALHPGLARRARLVREATGLPVIAGIGISTPQRAAEAARAGADAVVIGSAFTREVALNPGRGAEAVGRLAARFRQAMPAQAHGRLPAHVDLRRKLFP